MDPKLIARLLELAEGIADLVGAEAAERWLEIAKTSAQAYLQITGQPVDPSVLPTHIERIT